MKYILIIAIAIMMACCRTTDNKNPKWFSYDKLSQSRLEYNEFRPGDTLFFVGNRDYYFWWSQSALVLGKFPQRSDSDVYLFGEKYDLKSLYFNLNIPKNIQGLYVCNTYLVKVGGRSYFIFYIKVPRRDLVRGVLIDLTNPFRPGKPVKFPYLQLSYSPLCLNDFDQDGELDYAEVDLNTEKISCYHLIADRFVLDEQHYVSLIDKDSSNWFFKL